MHASRTLFSLSVLVPIVSIVGSPRAVAAVMSHGPLVSAVTATSATIWVRTDVQTAPPLGGVRIRYWLPGTPENWQQTQAAPTSEGTDFTLAVSLTGLSAATVYKYTVIVDNQDQLSAPYPEFKTFPSPTADPSFKFALLSDLIGWNDAPVLSALAAEEPAFVLILGDYDHRNPGNDADVRAGARTMHREVRQESDPASCAPDCPGDELPSNVFDAFPAVNVWDDHDYCCDDSDGTFDGNSPNDKPKSFQAHREYWPGYALANPNNEGLWHKFSYGIEVEIYVLDLRYQRAPKSDNDTCLGGIPSKSMLADFAVTGTNQKAWLKAQLAASTATWKFLISSVTWNRTTVKGDACLDTNVSRTSCWISSTTMTFPA